MKTKAADLAALMLTILATIIPGGARLCARETLNFNEGWRFALVSDANVRTTPIRTIKIGDPLIEEQTEEWAEVRLPHDWAIDRGFDGKLDGATGKSRWRGVGLYEKKFRLEPHDGDKRVVLTFDGAMSFPEIYVNGICAGTWDYGYVGFQVDATPFLKPAGEENEIVVRCDTREHRSRWYPGAGIYRDATMTLTSRAAWLPQGAVKIMSEVAPKSTDRGDVRVRIETTPEIARETSDVVFVARVFDPDGNSIGEWRSEPQSLKPNGAKNASLPQIDRFPQYEDEPVACLEFALEDVALWDVDAPRLHKIELAMLGAGGVIDSAVERVGFRKIELTVDDGFHLNGRRVQLNGVDLHHDQGLLGARSHKSAVRRQLSIMRDMGVNAIRTSHNPNSSAFMDLCDEMGIVVWDELFDKWDGTAGLRPEDDFDAFAARQARQFARRDRNRPSVFAWSIGNEIASIESNVKDASNPDQDAKRRVAFLRDAVRKYDSSRPVGLGCFVESAIGDYPPKIDSLAPLDVVGWNYGAKYRVGRVSYPNKPVVYTESSSAFSTRGYYDLRLPSKKDEYDYNTHQISSYDLISANGPRDIPDFDFQRMEEDRYVAGEFVWTGFDYLGESWPFEKEAKICFFGIVDLCGTPKDRFYLYRSHWNKKDATLHVLPHWNWNKGDSVPVFVYSSADTVELFLNGKSLGRKSKDLSRTLEKPQDVAFDLPDYYWIVDKYRLRWENVVFEPGTLEAVSYENGRETGRTVVKTAGEVARIEAKPEKRAFESDDDLVYVDLVAVDSDGVLNPTARPVVNVEIDGAAELAGLGTGDPLDLDSFADASQALFYGRATMILRSKQGTTEQGGEVAVIVRSEGLPETTLKIGVAPKRP